MSIPKQDPAIQVKLNKPGPAPGIGTENPTAAPMVQGTILQNPATVTAGTQLQTKSPSPTGEDSRRNRPIVAKINFVIA